MTPRRVVEWMWGVLFGFVMIGQPVRAATYYVDWASPHPQYPYASWTTAAQTIQTALDIASAGSTVLVAAGYYQVGSAVPAGGTLPARVLIRRPVTLIGVKSGNDRPYIIGAEGSGLFNCGYEAVRCLAATASPAYVSGFIFHSGHTYTNGAAIDISGGGVWAINSSVIFEDCRFQACSAVQDGGGAYRGTYWTCTFEDCRAWNGGGAMLAYLFSSQVHDCNASAMGGGVCLSDARGCDLRRNGGSQGGGAYGAMLWQCTVVSNYATTYGGGLNNGHADSCWFYENRATTGGGVRGANLRNCTLVANSALERAGGGSQSSFTNCIIWDNSASTYANVETNCSGSYNCVMLPGGMSWPHTIAADPQLRDHVGRYPVLRGNSPCINAGTNYENVASDRDLLGRARQLYGRVDLGACEYVPALNDYDGDGRSDLTTFRQVGLDWRMWTLRSGSSSIFRWGPVWAPSGYVPLPFVYTNHSCEVVGYREATGHWNIYPFADDPLQFGGPGLISVWGDYNGDGVSDAAVYDRAAGNWYIRAAPPDNAILAWRLNWGFNGAVPVPGDYDRDGTFDLAVYDLATGRWYIRTLTGRVIAWNWQWGYNGAIPVPGDYDGDGYFDLCVYDRVSARWYIQSIASGEVLKWGLQWGYAGARPVPGDFNGDSVFDLAVFDLSSAVWYVRELESSAPLYWNFYMRPGTAVGMVTW